MAPRRKVTIHVPPRGIPIEVPPAGLVSPFPNEQLYGSLALPAIPVTGKSLSVDLTNGGRMPRPATVKVGNLSGYVYLVTLQGHQDHLRPSETNVFATRGATQMRLEPVSGQTGMGTLLVAVAPEGVTFPGTWPLMNNRPFGPQTLLGTLVCPASPGGGSANGTFALDAGAQAIGFSWDESGLNNSPSFVEVIGQPTGTTYISVNPSTHGGAAGGLEVALLASAVDTDVQVLAIGQDSIQSTIYVIEFFELPVTFIQQLTGIPLTVDQSLSDPARWQAAQSSVQVKQAIGSGATFTPIAGVANQIIYVFGLNLSFDTAVATADLQIIDGDAAGTVVGAISATAIPVPPQPWYARPLSTGNGLTIKADGGAITVRGTILYTQV